LEPFSRFEVAGLPVTIHAYQGIFGSTFAATARP
jgi:hypothetical protein